MSDTVETTYITLTLDQLKAMVRDAEVDGATRIRISIAYEVLD